MSKNRHSTQLIVSLYTRDHLTVREIATQLGGISHAAVWKRLQRAGIQREAGTWVETECAFCGSLVRKHRASWRKTERSYCNIECYSASVENPGYHPWRQGQRLARAIVSQYYRIPVGAIVHHKDGDNRNNDRSNLQVLGSQSDHGKHHRGGKTVPVLWDGATVIE